MGAATGSLPTLPTGTRIGPFVLRGVASAEDGVVVYEAEHRASRRPVTIEVLDPGAPDEPVQRGEPQRRSELDRRMRLVASLTSPHVPKLLEVGELSSGQMYAVREQLVGATLAEWLARGNRPTGEVADGVRADAHGACSGLPIAVVVEIGVQLCEALESLRENGITLPGLQLRDVLLHEPAADALAGAEHRAGASGTASARATPTVKLLGVGLAAMASREGGGPGAAPGTDSARSSGAPGSSSELAGSDGALRPMDRPRRAEEASVAAGSEQPTAGDAARPTAAGLGGAGDDVRKLGALLFELLLGRASRVAAGDSARTGEARSSAAPRPSSSRDGEHEALGDGVPADLRALVSRALSGEPAARPASLRALGHELEHLARELALPRTPEVWKLLPARPRSRRDATASFDRRRDARRDTRSASAPRGRNVGPAGLASLGVALLAAVLALSFARSETGTARNDGVGSRAARRGGDEGAHRAGEPRVRPGLPEGRAALLARRSTRQPGVYAGATASPRPTLPDAVTVEQNAPGPGNENAPSAATTSPLADAMASALAARVPLAAVETAAVETATVASASETHSPALVTRRSVGAAGSGGRDSALRPMRRLDGRRAHADGGMDPIEETGRLGLAAPESEVVADAESGVDSETPSVPPLAPAAAADEPSAPGPRSDPAPGGTSETTLRSAADAGGPLDGAHTGRDAARANPY